MSESEIQPLGTLVLGRSDVLHLLACAQRIPDRIALLVSADIVEFREVEDEDVGDADAEEDLVAPNVCGRED